MLRRVPILVSVTPSKTKLHHRNEDREAVRWPSGMKIVQSLSSSHVATKCAMLVRIAGRSIALAHGFFSPPWTAVLLKAAS